MRQKKRLSSRAGGEGPASDVSAPSHDEAPASQRAHGAHDAGERRLTGKARNLFRAGARPTFFVAKKVGKENSLRPIQICQRIFGRDFSTRHPCLVEKRRTSCPSPSGSPIPEQRTRSTTLLIPITTATDQSVKRSEDNRDHPLRGVRAHNFYAATLPHRAQAE